MLRAVKQMRLRPGVKVSELVDEMRRCGVLGAGRIGRAAELVAKMFHEPDYTVFLALAGALVPGGLRSVIADLITNGYVHVLVSTGANVVHDALEALGYKHQVGSAYVEDVKLKEEGISRIADIYVKLEAFQALERWVYQTLEEIPEQKRKRISSAEILHEIGMRLQDEGSILAAAARKGVPIICPGLPDSIIGFQLWAFGQDRTLILDPLLDVQLIVSKVYEAKRVGAIILGGGWPKHFVLFANTFRDGVDCVVQITMDRPEPGGLSGASLEEAVSWGKLKPEGKAVTVVCDATIAFPLIVAAALEKPAVAS